jgi:3-oxoacyl-[acyl-carrier protein] reductase
MMSNNGAMELEGKVSLVTGASRGIGRAIALKLSSLGSKVVINDIAKDTAEKVVQEINGQGGEAFAVEANVSDGGAVKAMMEEITGRWEKIDILVNNAGINRDTLLLKMPDEAWDSVINTNLRGTYLCTKFALRSMMRQRWGRIISLASIAGIMGNVGQANYSASKAGIIAFTKTVAKEVGSLNINVNAVAPGFIVSEMTSRIPEDIQETMLKMTPLRRYGQPEEVAEVVAFLASEHSSYINGQVIPIDGGVT